MDFPGSSYSASLDSKRLEKQHDLIRDLMLDGRWRTLREIESITKEPQASISAQLRHLRKSRYGKYRVKKQRRRSEGLFEYQVLPPLPEVPIQQNLL